MYKNLKFNNLSGWNFHFKYPSHKKNFRQKFQSSFLISKSTIENNNSHVQSLALFCMIYVRLMFALYYIPCN